MTSASIIPITLLFLYGNTFLSSSFFGLFPERRWLQLGIYNLLLRCSRAILNHFTSNKPNLLRSSPLSMLFCFRAENTYKTSNSFDYSFVLNYFIRQLFSHFWYSSNQGKEEERKILQVFFQLLMGISQQFVSRPNFPQVCSISFVVLCFTC